MKVGGDISLSGGENKWYFYTNCTQVHIFHLQCKFDISELQRNRYFAQQKLNHKNTFSDTKLLLPFRSSGAIQGKVPLTPPEIRVWHFTFDRPKSPTCIPNYENNL
jgi:hypothetical protein